MCFQGPGRVTMGGPAIALQYAEVCKRSEDREVRNGDQEGWKQSQIRGQGWNREAQSQAQEGELERP